MMFAQERVFVAAHGPDDDAVAVAFRWLLRFAEQHDHPVVGIFVPSLRQVESLERSLGAEIAAALNKHRAAETNGVTIKLLIGTKPLAPFDGPIAAVWVDDSQLDKLEGLSVPGLCAIPWNRTDIDDWKANWNPQDLRTGEQGGDTDTVTNRVVVAALRSLTARVNLATGLSHPSDKASAVQMFRLLRDAGETYDPEQVRAWAARNGWAAQDARLLGEIADKIQAGRTVQTRNAGTMWRSDIVDQWRDDAAA